MGIVSDTFTRTVSNGWGTATTGQAWSTSGGSVSDYQVVSGGSGRQAHPAVNTLHYCYLAAGSVGQTVFAKVTIPVVPTGAPISAWVLGRLSDASNYYSATLTIGTSGGATLAISKRVGGVLSTIVGGVAVSGTHSAGNSWGVKLSVAGTTVRARAWKSTDTEPSVWGIETTDTSLSSGTQAGVASRTETGNTNGAINIDWDDFTVLPVEITATEQDTWPPRVLVSVTRLAIGDEIELFRVVGGERTAVRAGVDDAVSDVSFLRTDAELPFGVPVSYVARVNGDAEYTTSATAYALPGGMVAVSDAINGNAAETKILAWDQKARARQATVFKVGGRNVVVSGDLGMFEGDIELFTETTSSRDNLVATLEDATESVVQVRQPGGYDGVDSYVAILGVAERRWSQDGTDQRRVFTLNVAEVEGWAPVLEARGYTLQDLANMFPQADGLGRIWNDTAWFTLLDIAQADLS